MEILETQTAERKKLSSYKDLVAWQEAIRLVTTTYNLTKTFPESERTGLIQQINNTVILIPSNLAEGWGKNNSKNYLHCLRIGRGAIVQMETFMILAENLGYIDAEQHANIEADLERVMRLVNGLLRSISEKLKNTTTTTNYN